MAAGTFIPTMTKSLPKDMMKLSDKVMESLDDNFDNLAAILTGQQKTEIKNWGEERKARLEQVNAEKIMANILSGKTKPKGRIEKIKDKAIEGFEKFAIKHKWFETSMKYLKGIYQYSSQNIIKWLMALLVFALIDPDGSLLSSLFDLITNFIVMAIGFIMKMLPRVLKTMWSLFWNVVVPGFGKMFQAIGEAIFGKGVLANILGTLGKIVPILLFGLGILSKIGPAFMAVWKFGSMVLGVAKFAFSFLKDVASLFMWLGKAIWLKVIPAITTWIASLWAMVAPMLTVAGPIILIVLGIAALAAAFYAIWRWSDKIVAFFDGIINWFKKLGKAGKILTTVVAILLFPITMLIAAIYGLAKLFKFLKTVNWNKVWQRIKMFFTKDLPNAVSKFVQDIFEWFKNLPSRIMKWVNDVWDKFKTWLGTIPKRLLNWFSDVVEDIKDSFANLLDWILFKITHLTATKEEEKKALAAKSAIRYETKLLEKGGGSATEQAEYRKDKGAYLEAKLKKLEKEGTGESLERYATKMEETYKKKREDVRDKEARTAEARPTKIAEARPTKIAESRPTNSIKILSTVGSATRKGN